MKNCVPGLSDHVNEDERLGQKLIVPVIIVMIAVAVAYFVFVTLKSNNRTLDRELQKSIPAESR
jgi:hypothetical protein